MKQPYIIFSDISADILPAVAEENGIRFLPMHYTLGEEDRLCTQMEDEETLKRFYDGQRSGDLTRTSQIPPQAYVDTFLPVLEGGSLCCIFPCPAACPTPTSPPAWRPWS